MTLLRVDPWDPEHGASAVDLLADERPQSIEFAVEDRLWQPVVPPPLEDIPCCAFVDGVRRIDVRLFAEDESAIAPALAGSWAVGSAWSTRPPAIENVEVGHNLVVGGGLEHADLTTQVGEDEVVYRFIAVRGSEPLDPIVGLQNVMRSAEARLAAVGLSAVSLLLAITVIGLVFAAAIWAVLLIGLAYGVALTLAAFEHEPQAQRLIRTVLLIPVLGDTLAALAALVGLGGLIRQVTLRGAIAPAPLSRP